MTEALYNYLKEYMTEERAALFDKVASERTRHVTCVVENIYQPHNASAVLRSCDCFGVQDVHIIENDNDWEVNKGVSLGASKWLTINRYNEGASNTRSCLQSLKKKGYKIAATTPHKDDYTISDLPLDEPVALVFGTEVSGITQDVMDEADLFVWIPMYGFTESFNISVAAALSLYELTKRLREENIDWPLSVDAQNELKLSWAKQSIRESEKIIERFNG